jgi:hypothetical protein
LPQTISKIWYAAFYIAADGLYRCDHQHPTVRDAMNCIVPDGGSFIRAFESGAFRSLDYDELLEFVESLQDMPWSHRYKARGGALAEPTSLANAR